MRALHLGLAVAVVWLAACSSTPPPPVPQPKLAFQHEPIIMAPAAQVAFDNEYKPPMLDPNVEHQHDVRPAQVAEAWVDKRLKANSMSHGRLTVTVLDASVVQEDLPMDKSFKARLLERQPESKLTGTLKWRLTYAGPLLTSWTSEGVASSSGTVLEQSSLNDIDQTYADVLDGLATNFDKQMEQQLASLRQAQSDASDKSGH